MAERCIAVGGVYWLLIVSLRNFVAREWIVNRRLVCPLVFSAIATKQMAKHEARHCAPSVE